MIATDLIASVDEHLRTKASIYANKTAFYDECSSSTFADLNDRTRRLAAALKTMGLRKGDAVAIHVHQSARWAEICLGVVRAGAIAVPISTDSVADQIEYRLSDANCKVLFTGASYAAHRQRQSSESPCHQVVVDTIDGATLPPHTTQYEMMLESADSCTGVDCADLDAPSFILYTSGTTGRPKGVMLSQRNMFWVVAACWSPIAGIMADDHMLAPLPLYHSYGLNIVVLGTLAVGATARIMEKFSTSSALELLSDGPFTVLPAVPTMFHYILARAKHEHLHFGMLRLAISAGAIMSAKLNREFEERTGVPLIDGYGITETSTMVTLNSPTGRRHYGSAGVALPGLAVRIVDPTDATDVAPGMPGELLVRGPSVMQGYLDQPEATGRALAMGWYHTGDIGTMDRNAFVSITGRVKDIIIRGGENIAPTEIEDVAAMHEDVLDCAVVGHAHESLGEVPILFVIRKEGSEVSADELYTFLSAHLEVFKVPDQIHFLDTIPRTGSGKIKRFELRQLLS